MTPYEQISGQIGIVNVLVYVVSIVFLIAYGIFFSKKKPSLKKMIVIGLFSAIAFVLSFIKFVPFPQGGSINLLPMLPILLIGVLYGTVEGITCGLIYGVLTLIMGGHIIGIAEALMDYILSSVVLGLAGVFGRDNKIKILAGSILAVVLNLAAVIISGVYFYGMYAPPHMNLWYYSIIYNLSSSGVVGVLSIIVLMILPIKKLQRQVK
ncbi:energy-coupled thiamine transporter ThiT [uncultured Clostridium sp.]|uniref:energy-coupled thiamine transporter ThiT n=1 Tax=uncultured Clostridium sp. TaxID=59620 RepID=UPI00260BCE3A|nr:energy-coupled thiamine transporter ThiT [uncultured Clostridium sp.]